MLQSNNKIQTIHNYSVHFKNKGMKYIPRWYDLHTFLYSYHGYKMLGGTRFILSNPNHWYAKHGMDVWFEHALYT
jgi:hypothetical protein